jgi:L-amino acid N-acyltransferase YncA
MTDQDIRILGMQSLHWDAVSRIYQAGIDTGHATFANSPPSGWQEWATSHLNDFSLVALSGEQVLGWTAIASVSERCVYAGVAEDSVYIDPAARGQGIGRKLLAALIERTEARSIWTLQTGIFPENVASVALHERVGFRMVGTRRRLGKMSFGPLQGQWRDVLLLERRSACAGVD